MYFSIITHWDKELVECGEMYLEWFNNLKVNDWVAIQKYYPISQRNDFECYRYYFKRIMVKPSNGKPGELFGSENTRFNDRGIICDYDGFSRINPENIFPFRIVPLTNDWKNLDLDTLIFVLGDKAIYEPLLPCNRLYFLNREYKTLTFPQRKILSGLRFLGWHERDTGNGTLVTCYLIEADTLDEEIFYRNEAISAVESQTPLKYLYCDRLKLNF